MYIEIISPNEKIYTGEIHLVQLPGTRGSFEIMNNHEPIISTLEKGKIKVITQNGEELFFETDGGLIELSNNKINILTNRS